MQPRPNSGGPSGARARARAAESTLLGEAVEVGEPSLGTDVVVPHPSAQGVCTSLHRCKPFGSHRLRIGSSMRERGSTLTRTNRCPRRRRRTTGANNGSKDAGLRTARQASQGSVTQSKLELESELPDGTLQKAPKIVGLFELVVASPGHRDRKCPAKTSVFGYRITGHGDPSGVRVIRL